jgi:hypothetical protein
MMHAMAPSTAIDPQWKHARGKTEATSTSSTVSTSSDPRTSKSRSSRGTSIRSPVKGGLLLLRCFVTVEAFETSPFSAVDPTAVRDEGVLVIPPRYDPKV